MLKNVTFVKDVSLEYNITQQLHDIHLVFCLMATLKGSCSLKCEI